jgi:hypothetical protein
MNNCHKNLTIKIFNLKIETASTSPRVQCWATHCEVFTLLLMFEQSRFGRELMPIFSSLAERTDIFAFRLIASETLPYFERAGN